MTTLTIAFCSEGTTDERFLSSIIERTANELLHDFGYGQVDVLAPTIFKPSKDGTSGAERLRDIARNADGYSLLVIHADADDDTPQRALAERLEPGIALIEVEQNACHTLVPLIPVHMTEAWMLADHDLLRDVLNTTQSLTDDLGFPRPHNAEGIADPKSLLKEGLRLARKPVTRRRRPQLEISDLYTLLADIDLSKLSVLSSYNAFRSAMAASLRELSLIN